jgi:hypothetical protein
VLFTIMIVLSVIFVLQVSPPPMSSTGGRSYAQWKILCDDALRGIEVTRYKYDYIVGDMNGDGIVTMSGGGVSDLIWLLNWLQDGQEAFRPNPIFRADCNCDGKIDTADYEFLFDYLFPQGGPVGPSPNCEYKLSDESMLAIFLIYKDVTSARQYFDEALPDTCSYNIYISNGISTTLWYDGGVGQGGTIIRAQRTITIEQYFLQLAGQYQLTDNEIIDGYQGSMYIVILEVEYL